MRRGIGIVALLVVILGGIGVGVGAYRSGERHGIAEGIEQVQVAQENGQGVQVVHVVDDGRRGVLPRVLPVPALPVRCVLPDRRDLPRSRSLQGRTSWPRPGARGTRRAGAGSRSGPASGTSTSTARRRPAEAPPTG